MKHSLETVNDPNSVAISVWPMDVKNFQILLKLEKMEKPFLYNPDIDKMVDLDNNIADVRPPPASFKNKYLSKIANTPCPPLFELDGKRVIYGEEDIFFDDTHKVFKIVHDGKIVFGYKKPEK